MVEAPLYEKIHVHCLLLQDMDRCLVSIGTQALVKHEDILVKVDQSARWDKGILFRGAFIPTGCLFDGQINQA